MEFRVETGYEDEANAVYSSIDFGDERPPKDRFVASLLVGAPIADYAIESVEEVKPGRFEIVVAEVRRNDEAFLKQIEFDRLLELSSAPLEWASLPKSIVDERLGSLADDYVARWPQNYASALQFTATSTDTVTYCVEKRDGQFLIVIKDTTSKSGEERKARRTAEVKEAVSNLIVVSCELSNYSSLGPASNVGDVFVSGIVKNTGVRKIEGGMHVQVELLDREGRAVATDISGFAFDGLEPNFSDDFVVMFDIDKAAGWNGSYRVRIGDETLGIYGEWTHFSKER